jgi:hypothetical protein
MSVHNVRMFLPYAFVTKGRRGDNFRPLFNCTVHRGIHKYIFKIRHSEYKFEQVLK